jgi:hypothetical protein
MDTEITFKVKHIVIAIAAIILLVYLLGMIVLTLVGAMGGWGHTTYSKIFWFTIFWPITLPHGLYKDYKFNKMRRQQEFVPSKPIPGDEDI